MKTALWGVAVLIALAGRPAAQDHGFIGLMAVYPPGGAAGTTVDVDLRYYRKGVVDVTVSGPGIRATLLRPKEEPTSYDWQPDRGYPIFQNKCGACHALPNPVVLRYTRDEWFKVVETMVKKHGAPINLVGDLNEGSLIAKYLGKATQDAVGLRARLEIAADAPVGRREIRLVGKDWTSQIGVFEVTRDREVLEDGKNGTTQAAQALSLPVSVSGQLNEAREVDYYALDLRRGQRVIARCASHTLNARHFFPRLTLLDAQGKLLARDAGRRGFEPFIDFKAPEDGRFYLAVDDLFSRGSPEMVYRLKIADAPYEAALFPAGLKRGTSLTATLAGENAGTEAVELNGNAAPGIHRVRTSRGEFPYVVGEHPELVREPGPAPSVRLPAALNGRFLKAGQRDTFAIHVAPEEVGKPFSLELFGGRIGSPAELVVRMVEGTSFENKTSLIHSEEKPIAYAGKFDTNWPAYKLGARLFGRDERFDLDFPRPGVYTLELSEASGRHGAGYVYRAVIGPAEPDFDVAVTPDNPTVSPGSSILVELHPLRRHRLEGPIEVTIPGLPPGLRASRGIIRPGHGRSFLTITADPDAKPGLALRVRPLARTSVGGRVLTRAAIPYEFRDHCRDPIDTDELVVTVGRPAPWTVRLEPACDVLKPGVPLEIRVKVDRRDAKDGDIPFFLFSDSKDVELSGLPLVPSGASESKVSARLKGTSKIDGPIRFVVVSGLNEWIGATSGAMNRSSEVLQVNVEASPPR